MATHDTPYLTIVIPAHNEEQRLPPALAQIDAYLRTQPYTAEVIVVENGSHDRTAAVTRDFARTHPYVKLLEVTTRGKGLAVKAGMLAARGEYRFICDADLSMPIEEISKFLPPNHAGCDVLIGSREGPLAQRIGEPEYRHIMGRILNFIVKIAAVADFEDTQCGFKMFHRRAADDLFAVQQMTGIGFDVELIYVAQKRGYRIVDVPIIWHYNADSRMRLFQDSLRILQEIWQIRQNWRKGVYAQRETPGSNRQPQT
ncbi:MAG: glycosyltransferase family 2 protein [Anaerolineae bacterium]|nr:glycosyltransferase family 2 protein [Anaerolineae bacterium]